MSRPAGVTASAIVAILGSSFFLLMAIGMAAVPFIDLPQQQPPMPGQTASSIFSALMFGGLAALGIATAIGLLKLRSWARISIIVFAIVMALGSVFMVFIATVVPMPAANQGPAPETIRTVMAVMFGIPLLIAIWWLVQFNASGTKAAFAAGNADAVPSARPLGVTLIAWLSILGGASCLFPIFARFPFFLFGLTLTGLGAMLGYVFFGAVGLYIGRGLLDLNERARVLSIAWFVFTLVHTAVMTLIPSMRQRMLAMQAELAPPGQQPQLPPGFQESIMYGMLVFVVVLVSVGIWYLVRVRPLFANPPGNPAAP